MLKKQLKFQYNKHKRKSEMILDYFFFKSSSYINQLYKKMLTQLCKFRTFTVKKL